MGCSNACKFTPAGGQVTISTKLVIPHGVPEYEDSEVPDEGNSSKSPLESVVVRIEVRDTGCGIRRKDMIQSKLFCEYFCLLFLV